MPDIAAVLKEEITRLARKEVKQQVGPLKKTITEQRRTIVELKHMPLRRRRSMLRLYESSAS